MIAKNDAGSFLCNYGIFFPILHAVGRRFEALCHTLNYFSSL